MRLFHRLSALGLTLLLGACSVFGKHDVAIAPYTVLEKVEKFEIRNYPPLLVAQTRVKGDAETTSRVGFRRLFDYISGANTTQQSIAMTAPVLQQKPAGEAIAMTAPVFMARTNEEQTMSFVLPQGFTLAKAPRPTNPEVTLAETSAQKMAVVTFSGFLSETNIQEQTQVLKQWLHDRQLKPTGTAMTAGYDPPWTIPLWRRNEILMPIE